MKLRQIGKGGPKVGEIGFGAMSFGGIFGQTNEAESHRTLAKALDLGVTHIDTARIYGPETSENVIGTFLKQSPEARRRFVIATKGGIQPSPRAIINNAAFLRDCLEGSLRRLGVDHVPLYYVHRREQAIPIEDVMETLVQFKKEGKIGAFGLSEISPATLVRASKVHHVAAVQNEYSLWTRLPELGLIQACARLGTTLVAFSPLGRGFFSDQEVDPTEFPDPFRVGIPRFNEPNLSHNQAVVAKLRAFAKKRGWSLSALAVAWVLAQGKNILPIPGTRSPEHLASFAGASKIRLTKADLAAIDKIMPAGWAHGHRYNDEQQKGVEQYC